MGIPRPFAPAKLVVAVIASRPELRDAARERLQALFGAVDAESEPEPFTFTSYYDGEMGKPLSRWFLAFERLVVPDSLPAIKLATNALEAELAESGRRTFNLDPGLLTLARFSLATTKESAHRIPLRDGIYAELTLKYEKGGFRPLPWTYPDYRSARYLAVLERIRARLKEQLRESAG
jgi:hypothetical protein